MKTFACGAVVPGCTFTVAAETEDDLLQQVARHATDDHGITELPASLVARVRASIVVRD